MTPSWKFSLKYAVDVWQYGHQLSEKMTIFLSLDHFSAAQGSLLWRPNLWHSHSYTNLYELLDGACRLNRAVGG